MLEVLVFQDLKPIFELGTKSRFVSSVQMGRHSVETDLLGDREDISEIIFSTTV